MDLLLHAFTFVAGFGGGGSGSGGSVGGGGFSGGGSTGAGGSGDMNPWVFGLIICFVIGCLIQGIRAQQRARVAAREREQRLWTEFQHTAPGWNEEQTEGYVQSAFVALNAAWTRLDADAMRPWLTPRMFDKMSAMVAALRQMGRRNEVRDLVPGEFILAKVATQGTAGFTVRVQARSTDVLLEATTGQALATSSSGVDERWSFVSDGTRWLLDDIRQQTESQLHLVRGIEQFASEHGLHYSADYGRVQLPDHGAHFDGASLEVSDVNNHVIGWYRGSLVQLYTYERRPDGNARNDFVIAQLVLPREVGDILVRRRGGPRFRTKGLQEVTLESVDFHRTWQVHASRPDELTTFELLHPAFLERLTNLPFRVGMEAVGTNLYVFAETGEAPYEQMFELLEVAYRELRR
jgi:hypothetical protein